MLSSLALSGFIFAVNRILCFLLKSRLVRTTYLKDYTMIRDRLVPNPRLCGVLEAVWYFFVDVVGGSTICAVGVG